MIKCWEITLCPTPSFSGHATALGRVMNPNPDPNPKPDPNPSPKPDPNPSPKPDPNPSPKPDSNANPDPISTRENNGNPNSK